jgi:hypothetical protein
MIRTSPASEQLPLAVSNVCSRLPRWFAALLLMLLAMPALAVPPAPVLTAGTTPTTSNPYPVSGTATPDIEVRVYVGGTLEAVVNANASGAFSASVPLLDGANTIIARAWDASGESPDSNSLAITYNNTIPRTQSGTIAVDTVWTAGTTGPYVITGNLVVPAGVTFTIRQGAQLKFVSPFSLQVSGALKVRGSSASRVVFTSNLANPYQNSWGSIELLPGAINTTIDYATVEWAVHALYFNGGSATVTNSIIRNSSHCVYVRSNNTAGVHANLASGNALSNCSHSVRAGNGTSDPAKNPRVTMRGGSLLNSVNLENYATPNALVFDFTNNWWGSSAPPSNIWDYNDNASLPLVDFSNYLNAAGGTPVLQGPGLGGRIASDTTLAAGPYQVIGNVDVPAGVTLTVSAGAQLRFAGAFAVNVSGGLTVAGNAASPALFTSYRTTVYPGDWTGIQLLPGATNVLIEHAIIELAQIGIHFNGRSGTVRNSKIRKNNLGVRAQPNGVSGVFANLETGNELTGNGYYSIDAFNGTADPAQNPVVTAKSGAITSTAQFRNYATPHSLVFDFANNWWGSTSLIDIENRLIHKADNASLPQADYIGYRESLGGPPAMVVWGVSVAPWEIRPLQSEFTTINYTMNAPGSTKMEVRDIGTNTKVYEATNTHTTFGRSSFTWNGRDQSGNIVGLNEYKAVLIGSDASRSMTYDPAPTPDGIVTGTIPATYRPYRNEFMKLPVTTNINGRIRMGVYASSQFYPYPWRFYTVGTHWFYWDGREPDGSIAIGSPSVIFDAPSFGAPHYITVSGHKPVITGPGAVPNIEVKTDPYLIVQSYEQFTRFAYRIDMDSYVTVKLLPPGIYDPANSQAMTLVDNELRQARDAGSQPIDHWVEWRGYSSVSPNNVGTQHEGNFTVTIQARSQASNVTTLYRAALAIYK